MAQKSKLELLDLPDELLDNIYRFVVDDLVIKYLEKPRRLAYGWSSKIVQDEIKSRLARTSSLSMMFVSKRQRSIFKQSMFRHSTISIDWDGGMRSFVRKPPEDIALVQHLRLRSEIWCLGPCYNTTETSFLVAKTFFSMLPNVKTIGVLMNTREQTVRTVTDLAQPPSFGNSLRYILWGLTRSRRDVPNPTCSSEIRSPWLRLLLSKELLRACGVRTTPRVYGLVRVVYESRPSTASVNHDATSRNRRQHLICDLEQWTVKGTVNGQHFTIPQHRPNADLLPLESQSLLSNDFMTSTLKAAFEEGFGRTLTDTDMKRGITKLLHSKVLDASELTTSDRFKRFLDAWRAFGWGVPPENLTRFLYRAWANIETVSGWDEYYCIGLSLSFRQLDLKDYEQAIAYIAGAPLAPDQLQRLQRIWNSGTLQDRPSFGYVHILSDMANIVIGQQHLTSPQVERLLYQLNDISRYEKVWANYTGWCDWDECWHQIFYMWPPFVGYARRPQAMSFNQI